MTPTAVRPLPTLDPNLDPSQNHYWSYHSLPTLLACKQPLTASADEDLFIAVHQVCELCFHQMILDLDRVLEALEAALPAEGDEIGDLGEAVYFLERVNSFWAIVNSAMPTLAGMRAFAEFRTSIGPTSGFQSFQFRKLEILSGVERYWTGGTADAEGRPHIAETKFDEVYGEQISACLEVYRTRNLKAFSRRLTSRRAHGDLRGRARELARRLAQYDAAQLEFHRRHLGMAATQLRKVGADVGTGGTSFRTYLASYETLYRPLFPEIDAWLASGDEAREA